MTITTGASDGATAITDASRRYKAGVLKYRQMGYWEPDYVPKATDTVCLFRITPQEGVDPIEQRRRSPGVQHGDLGTVVWTDRLNRLRYVPRQGVQVEVVPNSPGQFFRLGRVRHHSFRRGLDRQHDGEPDRNVFSFKPLKAARLEDIQIPAAYVKTFKGPPTGLIVERERLDKFGRPLLGATTKPKLGLSAATTAA